MIRIYQAKLEDISTVIPLFDSYRQFYGQVSNLDAAEKFLAERFNNEENVVFLAEYKGMATGFVQLYYTFSSVRMEPFLILNDLFVDQNYRGKGIGEALLNAAKEFCLRQNYKGLALETANDNPAQKLYERLGWKKNTEFLHYFWSADN